jgi:hypothetical protein
MEPQDPTPIDAADLRVELRRFLGGIPFSHTRELSPEERKQLRRKGMPYFAVGGGAILVGLASVFGLSTAAAPMAVLFIVMMIITLGLCAYWARPFVQALRSDTAYVYIGRMNDLVNFDVAQSHYRSHEKQVEVYVNRYIELVAVGKGDRIWHIEGIPNDETLAGVRSIWLALVPDHDEQGERPLTEEEIAELRLRSREFIQVMPFITSGIAASAIVLAVIGIAQVLVSFLAAPLGFLLWVATAYLIWTPYSKRWKFGEMLRKDARAGKVRDGILTSGLPWVVKGEPARWRVGRPKGGTNGVTKEQALWLEEAAGQARKAAENAPSPPLPMANKT